MIGCVCVCVCVLIKIYSRPACIKGGGGGVCVCTYKNIYIPGQHASRGTMVGYVCVCVCL